MRAGPDTLRNPAHGETVTVRRRGGDGDGAALELLMELDVPGAGPPAHAHPRQTETFRVVAGRLRLTRGGEVVTLGPGQSAEVPPGLVHTWTADCAGTRVEVAVRPALRFESVLERAFALVDAGAVTAEGVRDPVAVDAFLADFAGEYRLASPTPGAGAAR